jgi:hypothetical protein
MKKIILSLCISLLPFVFLSAQEEEMESKNQFKLGLFVESYYSYDFNNPEDKRRPANIYNHARHNELTINLAMLQMGIETDKYRANLALQAGTFPQYNWAHEPAALQHVFEANVGLKLWGDGEKALWLDAGMFPSHLGFADAKVTGNWTLSRPMSAEESPYYLSGAKLSFNPSEQLDLMMVVCNGWQNMMETEGNSNKAVGLQAVYTPSDIISVNYSNFFGNEMPDTAKQYRFFNNFYTTITPSEQLGFIVGLDYGMQQDSAQNNWDNWLVASLVGHYAFNDHWELAARAEYMQDANNAINSFGLDDYNMFNVALNLNYKLRPNAQLRVEGKLMNAINQDAFIDAAGDPSRTNFALTVSAAVDFGYRKEW